MVNTPYEPPIVLRNERGEYLEIDSYFSLDYLDIVIEGRNPCRSTLMGCCGSCFEREVSLDLNNVVALRDHLTRMIEEAARYGQTLDPS